jgi:hypothetical protein
MILQLLRAEKSPCGCISIPAKTGFQTNISYIIIGALAHHSFALYWLLYQYDYDYEKNVFVTLNPRLQSPNANNERMNVFLLTVRGP